MSVLNTDVLIVDDFSTMRKIVRRMLTQLGLTNIEEARDGSEALRRLSCHRFGLIFTDWNMLPMTGIDMLRAIRADAVLCDIPVIMITSEARSESVMEAKAAGVTNLIVKPFNLETLKSKIETVLGPIDPCCIFS